MDIATALAWSVARYPHRPAVGGSSDLTYAEWHQRIHRVARRIRATGVRRGDRVALCLTGGEPLATLHLACQLLGVVSVPLSTRFSADEIAYCLDDCGAAVVVIDDLTAPTVQDALQGLSEPPVALPVDDAMSTRPSPDAPLPTVSEDDISVMLYTSGTTGRPKGVPRSHRAEHAAAVAHLVQTGTPPFAVTLGVMPLFHTMGMRTLLASVIANGTWVPQPRFDAAEAVDLIIDGSVDTLYLVPTIYWSLLETGILDQARSLRRIAYAGAPMTASLSEALIAILKPERFVNHFGSTEIYTFTVGPDPGKPGCAGRAGLFGRVRLVDPDDRARPGDVVAAGEQGQVVVDMRSPEAFRGYWNRPDADEKAIRDGWYFTGDLATEDTDGDIWVSGRVDDMINTGGENVYPEQIEDVLARCPAARRVVVGGTAHEKWGSAVTAYIVPAPGVDPTVAVADMERWIRDESGLPSLKRPKRVIAIDSIPVSGVGKVLRRHLREGDYALLADSAVTP